MDVQILIYSHQLPKIPIQSQEGGVCGFGIARQARAWASPGFAQEPHHVYDICHTSPPYSLSTVCFLWPARRDRTGPFGSKVPHPMTRGWGVQARNIVRRERVEYTCSPMDREFDMSDTQACDAEGVRTYRLVVQLLPIVLGPTWRPSTLPVQTQISTTRVSSRKSSDGHKHRLYSPWFLIPSTRGTFFWWGRYIPTAKNTSSLFISAARYYAFKWSNRRDAHGQSTYKPFAWGDVYWG